MTEGKIIVLREDGRIEMEMSDLEPPRWKIDELAGDKMMATFRWSHFMRERATVFRVMNPDKNVHVLNALASELIKLDIENTPTFLHGPVVILTGACSYWKGPDNDRHFIPAGLT